MHLEGILKVCQTDAYFLSHMPLCQYTVRVVWISEGVTSVWSLDIWTRHLLVSNRRQLRYIHLMLKTCEPKPSITSQQCVLYNCKCDLWNAEYVGYTSRHLHQRIDEHRYSAMGKHLKNDHSLETISDLTKNFSIFKKCNGKLNCLIYEMFFIKKIRPCLNTQSDSIGTKLFNFVTFLLFRFVSTY